jgi:hypothetical protein
VQVKMFKLTRKRVFLKIFDLVEIDPKDEADYIPELPDSLTPES